MTNLTGTRTVPQNQTRTPETQQTKRKAKPDLPPCPTAAFATVEDFCRLSGLTRSATYLALARGDLRARKSGRRTLIELQAALAWVQALPAATFRSPS